MRSLLARNPESGVPASPPSRSELLEAYYHLFEHNPRPMWVYDRESLSILAVNDAAIEQYGFTREEFLARTIIDLRAPEDAPVLRDFLASPAAGGANTRVVRHRRKDGSLFHVEVLSHALTWGGRAVRIVTARDVTERQRAAEEQETATGELRKREQYFRALLENAYDVTVVLDRSGGMIYCSPSVERVFGYTPEDLLGRSVLEFVHPDDAAVVQESFVSRLTSTGIGVPEQYRFRHCDGSYLVLEVIGNSLFDHAAVHGLVINARDITARKQAELASRRNEERLRAAQQLAGLSDWEWDIPRDCVTWSDEIVRILGLDVMPERLDARSYLAYVHPEDRSAVESALSTTLAQGTYVIDHRVIRPDGEIRYLHCRGYAERDEHGALLRMAGTAQDLTELRRTEQMLKRRVELEVALSRISGLFVSGGDARLNQVLEILRDLVGACRAYIVLMDEGGGRMSNTHEVCAPGIAPQISHLQDLDPDLFPWWMTRMRAGETVMIPDVTALPHEAAAERASLDAQSIVSLLAVPVMGPAGTWLGCIGFEATMEHRLWADEDVRALQLVAEMISSDVERTRATDALRTSEQRIRFLMEQFPGAFWMTDADLRFTFAKFTGAVPTTGQLPDPEVGTTLFDYFGTVDPEFQPIASHRQALEGHRVSYEMSWKGRAYQTFLEPIRDRGNDIAGIVGIALDVTERVALEEQLRLAQKMEAVGRLAGGIAHDFNNVLTAISGNVALLLEDTPADDPRRADIHEVGRSAARAAELTGQLLAFGRKQLRQPRVLNVRDVLSEMQRMVRRLIGEDITLVMNVAEDLGSVEADQNQLEQVILNLIVNARDAMPNGGCLFVDARDAALTSTSATGAPPGSYVSILVRDTGSGIDQQIMPHIFEPFFTSKAPGHGTGLGLATVYSIVQQTGGFIDVSSSPEEGTRFTILLPRVSAYRSAPAPAPVQTSPRGSEKVLLVEDEEAVRSLARRVLERSGYRVHETNGGAEALAALDAAYGCYDIIVTDVVMPGMNGRELAEQTAERWPDVRVLFTSGYTEDEVLRRGIFLASEEFLPKPFTPGDLCRKVRAVLDSPCVARARNSD